MRSPPTAPQALALPAAGRRTQSAPTCSRAQDQPQTELLFGCDRDQLIGEPVEKLVPEPLWQICAQHRDDYFADPRTRSSGLEVELSGRNHSGGDFPINVSMSHIDTGDVLLVITAVRDVSTHRQAVRNAELIEAVVECSDDAITSMTLDGIVTSWNPAAEEMSGYSSKEVIGRPGRFLLPEDRAGEMNTLLGRIRDGQTVKLPDFTFLRKDGTPVPISIAVSPIRDAGGEVIGLVSVYRDVSAQKGALEVSQRMASIVNYSDDAIIGSTLGGVITSWNAAAERLFGYTSQEMVGTSALDLSPRDRPDEIATVLDRVRAGEHIHHLETTRVRKNGKIFPVSLTVSPICDADGAVVGTSMISRNMTELRHAAEYARSLIEADPHPLVTIGPEGKINDVNNAAVTITGVPRDTLIGSDILVPEDRAAEPQTVRAKIIAGRPTKDFETVRVRKGGAVFPVSVTVSPIRGADGEVIGTDFSQYWTDPERAREGLRLTVEQGSVTSFALTARHRDGTLTDALCSARIYHDLDGAAVGVLVAAHDVTQQNQVYETAQRLASIVKDSDDAITSGSLDGRITSWNPAAERMYGYASAEVLGKPADFLIPKDHADEINAVLQQIKAGRQVEHLETRRRRKDGTVFPVSLTVSPIRDDGRIVGTSMIHRDLTERLGALASDRRLAAIVQSSRDAIIGRTIDGIITSWNPAAARMFGYSGEEVVGKNVDLLTPRDRTGETISILAKISAGRPLEDFETVRVRKDGTLFPVSLTISPMHDGGSVVGASVTCRDLTELKHAAQYARSLLEATLDPMVTISPEGKINDVNEAAAMITGISRHKLIGTDFSQYFAEPDKAHECYQRAFEQGSITDSPLTMCHRDGSLTEVSYNASIYRDPSGKVLGVLATARDMTWQKKAFEAAQRIAAIVENSEEAIVDHSLDGIITSWNPAAQRMFGYSSEEIVGRSCSLLSPEDRIGEIEALLTRIGQGRPVESFETICTRKDRTTIPVKLTITPIRDAGGSIVGGSAIARDMYSIARDAAE